MLPSPTPLHIPDGFLATWVSIFGWLLAIVIIAYALRQTRLQLGERQVPIMGVLAAFIFAAQAVNFPVAAGTSGHLLGGALAAIVLGPWAATLIMTAVIGVQAFLFQDGGLLALGWNILNMGVLTAFTGFLAYTSLGRILGKQPVVRAAAAFTAGWLSLEVGAIATAIELAVSRTSPLAVAVPAMAGVHALIGLGEGLITSGAVSLLHSSRPEVLSIGRQAPGRTSSALILTSLMLALVLAGLSPLASSQPDGLEFVADRRGFLSATMEPVYELLPDYTVPFIRNPAVATIAAVGLGTILVFTLAWLVGHKVVQVDG